MENKYPVGEYQIIDFGKDIKLQVLVTDSQAWPVHGLLLNGRLLHITFAGGEDFPAWNDGEHIFAQQNRSDAVVTYLSGDALSLPKLKVSLGSNELTLQELEQEDRYPLVTLLTESLAVHCRYTAVSQQAGTVIAQASVLPDHRVVHLERGYALVGTSAAIVIAVVFPSQRKAFKTNAYRNVYIAAIDGDSELAVAVLEYNRYLPAEENNEEFQGWIEELQGQ